MTERRAGLTDLGLQPVTVVNPVILVYGVLFGFGIVSDIVRLNGGPIIPVDLIASPMALVM